jgi:DNA-binding MarR family transcriptional regulator
MRQPYEWPRPAKCFTGDQRLPNAIGGMMAGTSRRKRNEATVVALGPGRYVLEDQIGFLLRRAHQRATGIFMAELGEADQITPTQFAALVKLRDLGARSQNELGRLTAMDPVTIQGVIRRLVQRKLIERSADRNDRRRAVLRLTRNGKVLIDRLIPRGFRVSARTLEPLTPTECEQFLRFLARLT